jgi:hypothetical protein
VSAEKRPEGRSSKSAGGRDKIQSSRDAQDRTRTEHLVDELVAGRWPGDELPRIVLEQVVALASIRNPGEREAIARLAAPSSFRDHECRVIVEAALAVDPTADAYEVVARRLHDEGMDRSPVDLLLAGGDLGFLAGAVWRQALVELARRIEVDRVRDAATAAVVSLDAGGDPGHVAERLARRVVAADA